MSYSKGMIAKTSPNSGFTFYRYSDFWDGRVQGYKSLYPLAQTSVPQIYLSGIT